MNFSSPEAFISDKLSVYFLTKFKLAFKSLSITNPHLSQLYTLSDKVKSDFILPQQEHFLLLGKNVSTKNTVHLFHFAL